MYPDSWHLLFDEPRSKKAERRKKEQKDETYEKEVKVVVVCGPSGVGKGTLLKNLKERFPNDIRSTISHTTRQPRTGEVNGKEYHFISKEKFENMLNANEFLEHAQVHGEYYGTSNLSLFTIASNDQIALLEIDYVFITMSGGIEKLKDRLKGRGTETNEQVQRRMKTAEKELTFFQENPTFFDKVIINDDFEKSSQEFVETFTTWFPTLKS
ncbi:Guanylate kinase family protein [Reticulomyxa filosa]|uniref:Guanylate kinase family protein n=1 Tax=Reticulomyxa filosa TaxID=46433 RepID=X6MDJ4_RETFI|nr:Guanylate kinase family protein [Reticulomyxa filosa]|eukprot:ETO11939.1 Guanylate kinase family protein [Reticulomyxa filosa]